MDVIIRPSKRAQEMEIDEELLSSAEVILLAEEAKQLIKARRHNENVVLRMMEVEEGEWGAKDAVDLLEYLEACARDGRPPSPTAMA